MTRRMSNEEVSDMQPSFAIIRWALVASVVLLCVIAAPASGAPAPGTLDATFSGDGRATINFAGDDGGNDVAVQGDGKVLIAGTDGTNAVVITRLLVNGALDPSFSGDGKVTTLFSGPAWRVSLRAQPDGRIVAAAAISDPESWGERVGIARYLPNGSPDMTFGFGGRREPHVGGDSIDGITFQPDGKILVSGAVQVYAGHFGGWVTRLTASGDAEASFDDQGEFGGGAGAPISQPDGKVLVNMEPGLMRLLPDFRPDPTFGDGGAAPQMLGPQVVQPDGRILGAGAAPNGLSYDLGLERRLPNGAPDPSFGVNGIVTVDLGTYGELSDVVRQPNGRIVAVGHSDGMPVVARFLADGRLDPSFGPGGRGIVTFPTTYALARLALGGGGKIVAVGSFGTAPRRDVAVVRLWGDPVPACSGRVPTIASGEPLIYGTTRADVILGSDGPDRIYAGAGDDAVCSSQGADTVFGEFGNDRLLGGRDGDRLEGGRDNDLLYGEAGNDLLFGNTENDRLDGGADTDRADGGPGTDIGLNNETQANIP